MNPFPICPPTTRERVKGGGRTVCHPCLAKHKQDPDWVPRGKSATRRARGEARPRATVEPGSESEGEEGEGGEE